MTLVSLSEFQQLTGLSDRALIVLLSDNALNLELDDEKGLLLDIESCENKDLVSAVAQKQKDLLPEQKQVFVETFAKIISENFDELMKEALSILSSTHIEKTEEAK